MKKGRNFVEGLTGAAGSGWLVLAGVMLVAFVIRVEQARRLPSPLLLCDEFIYADLAKSVAAEGRLLFRGEPLHLSLLYPILLAPAWMAERMETTYSLAKTINVALMTSSAVPLYLLGRRVVGPAWALLAPVLTLLLPMTLLSGLLMTESAFMPAFLLSMYAIVRVLEKPSLPNQAFVLATIGIAAAVRTQGVVLGAILPSALLLLVVFEWRAARRENPLRLAWQHVRPYWPTAAVFAAAAVFYLGFGGFGAYEPVTDADYSLGAAWRSVRLHLADLALTSGLVPLSALLLLLLRALLGKAESRSERAFLAAAVPAVAWLLFQVGLFTSQFVADRVAERYVFYALPLMFLALAVWLADGMPRPWLPTALAAAAPAALVVTEPLGGLLSAGLMPSSLGLFSFYRLSTELDGGVGDVVWVMRIGSVVAAVVFALLWRPVARLAVPLGLGVFLLVSTHPVVGQLRAQSIGASSEPALSPNRQWIDDTVGDAEVGYLYTAPPDVFTSSRTMLTVNFWNPTVDTVIHVGEREVCSLPARGAEVDQATGRIVPEDGGELPAHLISSGGLEIGGTALARQGALTLYRAVPPASLLHSVTGVYSDRWMGADATYTRYVGPGPGQATVELSRRFFTPETKPATVVITAGPLVTGDDGTPQIGRPQVVRRAVVKPGEERVFVIPARMLPLRLSLHIEPTFAAAGFGGGDPRQLGAQVQFGFRTEGG